MRRWPVIDQWYHHLSKGYRFQVIAVNEGDLDIAVQHFSGDIEELDFTDWYALDVEPIGRPQDWVSPIAGIARQNPDSVDDETQF